MEVNDEECASLQRIVVLRKRGNCKNQAKSSRMDAKGRKSVGVDHVECQKQLVESHKKSPVVEGSIEYFSTNV